MIFGNRTRKRLECLANLHRYWRVLHRFQGSQKIRLNRLSGALFACLIFVCPTVYGQTEPESAFDEKQFPELNSPELKAEARRDPPKCSEEMLSKLLKLNEYNILADRYRIAGEDSQDAFKSYESFRKARLLQPGFAKNWLLEAKALKSLGKFDESLELLSKAPVDTNFERDFLALKAEILICQKKYQDALIECDNLQIGTRLGKPFYIPPTILGQDYRNHLLRSKIFRTDLATLGSGC